MIPMLTATILMSEIASKLLQLWLWDIEVLSNPWMYYPALIPAILFAVFVSVKWVVITIPIWTPFWILILAMRRGAK